MLWVAERGRTRCQLTGSDPHTVEKCQPLDDNGSGSVRVPVLERLRSVRGEGAPCMGPRPPSCRVL